MCGLISYYVCPRNRILLGMYMAVCYRIVKSIESSSCSIWSCLWAVLVILFGPAIQRSITIAELRNNLEPIVYKYNSFAVTNLNTCKRVHIIFLYITYIYLRTKLIYFDVQTHSIIENLVLYIIFSSTKIISFSYCWKLSFEK